MIKIIFKFVKVKPVYLFFHEVLNKILGLFLIKLVGRLGRVGRVGIIMGNEVGIRMGNGVGIIMVGRI